MHQPNLDFGTNANTGTINTPAAYNMFLARFDPVPLDVSENEMGNASVFPNPNDGRFAIRFSKTVAGTVSIADMQGRIVYSNAFEGPEYFFDLGAVQSGIYVISVAQGSEVGNFKILVR